MSSKTFYIRTSDRISFRNCQRAWKWGSLDMLGSSSIQEPLWFGSAFHYALEDYHGHKHFGSAEAAFDAFVRAHDDANLALPDNVRELQDLAEDMLEYYEKWLTQPHIDSYETVWYAGEPLVEVNFAIKWELEYASKMLKGLLEKSGYNEIVYRGQLDRIVEDIYGNWWIMEYKTAAQYRHFHLETDPQVTAYLWAAQKILPQAPVGVIYQQHHKSPPKPPRVLANGKLSTALTQNTSALLYREKMEELYGSTNQAPEDTRKFLELLRVREGEGGDRGVKRDVVTRNDHQLANENDKIENELIAMLVTLDEQSGNYPYPNPTDRCRWCAFQQPCIAVDSGLDYHAQLERYTSNKEEYGIDTWRNYLPERP